MGNNKIETAGMKRATTHTKQRRRSVTRRNHHKSVAKLGMAGSLGALVISGFMKFPGAKALHLYAGVGLLGFTLWHHLLNRPAGKSTGGITTGAKNSVNPS